METRNYDIVIIGAGPAGIFTALEITRLKPESHVLIADTGHAIASRDCPARKLGHCVHCDPCGIVHGWAGAGAFSDGKLSLSDEVGGHISEYVGHDRAMELIRHADEIYLKFGAPTEVHGLDDRKVDEISYEASKYNIRLVPCPVRHLGTENAMKVLGGMHDYLVSQTHTEFMELTTASDILVENGKVCGVRFVPRKGEPFTAISDKVVVAPGRGGAEWLADQVNRLGLKTHNNEVDIGVRVEVPFAVMDQLTRHLYVAKLIF